ncbi:hypothetical protein I4U23_005733 [Adineta vaga]|nr:hypothetical protein I4U23_005733 [Adineta vaga]
MIADAMIERFDFVSLRSFGSLVANRLQVLPQHSIRVKFLLLFVHMINGKKFIFDQEAQYRQKQFTDELTARSLRFERFDPWLSVRFRKSREYSLRMCAYLAIMKIAYELAHEFVLNQSASFNSYDRMTIDLYKNVKQFVDGKNIPDTLLINEETIQSSHKATLIMILKYMNLTSINIALSSPIEEVPVGPLATSMAAFGMQPIPSTQEVADQQQQRPNTPPLTIYNNKEFRTYCKNLMMIDSILFTRSSTHKESQLKKNLKYFDQAVVYLHDVKLLNIYKDGMISADGKPFACYMKVLPKNNTQKTVLDFSKVLDSLDVQYPTYISTFNTIWLPDRNHCSNEVLHVLMNKPYDQYNFEIKYLPAKTKAAPTVPSTTTQLPSTVLSTIIQLSPTGPPSTIIQLSPTGPPSTIIHIPPIFPPLNVDRNALTSESNDLLNSISTSLTTTSPPSHSSIIVNNNVPRLSTVGTEQRPYDKATSTTRVERHQSISSETIAAPVASFSRSSSESSIVEKEIVQVASVREQGSKSSLKRKVVSKRTLRSSNRRKK